MFIAGINELVVRLNIKYIKENMSILKSIKNAIRRRKIKSLLKIVTEIIYSNEQDLNSHLENKFLQNKSGLDLLLSYLVIRMVAETNYAFNPS
jgi:hypothetical protein